MDSLDGRPARTQVRTVPAARPEAHRWETRRFEPGLWCVPPAPLPIVFRPARRRAQSHLADQNPTSGPPSWAPTAISAGIFKQSMGARNRVRIELSYRPASLYRLAKLIPWKQFLNSLTV
jgi:hypothetical protein